MEAEIQVTLSLTAYRQQTPGPLEAGKGRSWFFPRNLRGGGDGPAHTLILDFWPPDLWQKTFHCFRVPFVIICHGSPRKLTQHLSYNVQFWKEKKKEKANSIRYHRKLSQRHLIKWLSSCINKMQRKQSINKSMTQETTMCRLSKEPSVSKSIILLQIKTTKSF